MSNLDKLFQAVYKNDLNAVKVNFRKEYLNKIDKNDFTPFLYACNSGFTSIAKFFLDENVNIETVSENGWNALHWAAGNGRDEIVGMLLARGARMETETARKCRPIHVAVTGNHERCTRLLLAYGCDWGAKDRDGKTALQLANDLGSDECRSLLRKWTEYDKIFNTVRQHKFEDFVEAFVKERVCVMENNAGKTVVDEAVEAGATDCLEHILLQDLNEDIIIKSLHHTLTTKNFTGDYFTLQYRLYRSIIFDRKDQFDEHCSVEVANSAWILTGESFLEVAVKFNRKDMAIFILQSSLDENCTFDKELQIANQKGFVKIMDAIKERIEFLHVKERVSFNRLYVAIQDNRADVVQFLLANRFIEADSCDHVLGTPLCFSLLLGLGSCVQVLLDFNVNVNIPNQYGQTPLHIAIENGVSAFVNILAEKTEDVDRVDCFHSTALHLAVINKDDDLCRILLRRGANLLTELHITERELADRRFTAVFLPLSCAENAVSLSLKLHRVILPSLVEHIDIDNVHSILPDGSTFLHLAARLLVCESCDQLIRCGADLNYQNREGNTVVHSLFVESFHNSWQNEGFLETLQILVDGGANINLLNNAGVSSFRCAFDTGLRNVLNTILNRCEALDSRIDDFFAVYMAQWPEVLETMLNLQKDEFKKHLVIRSVERGLDDFIDFVLDKCTDEFNQSVVEDCLYNAAKYDKEAIFGRFLTTNLNAPRLFPDGQTLLTRLIVENDGKYSLRLVRSEAGERYVDLMNQYGQTPLYLAADSEWLKLCKCLVEESHSLNYKDIDGETALERLLKRASNTNDNAKLKKVEKIVKAMIQAGMDINRFNKNQERAITFCKNVTLRNKLESFQTKYNKNHPHNTDENDEEKNTCEICTIEKINCQFGCGHAYCRTCASKVDICPTCRSKKTNIIPLYLH